MALSYEVIRSSRRSVAIQIMPDGRVVVRCPRRMGADAVRAFVESRTAWIEKHLSNLPPRAEKFTAAELEVFREQTAALAVGRVAYYAPLVGADYGRISVRIQRSRWGSCSSKGNLNFNALLALVPPEVLDYVVVHELCHRKAMNHSPQFWAEVERVLPDYRLHRQWLKRNGVALIARLP